MSVLKGKTQKSTILINSNIEQFKHWAGMTLAEVDDAADLKNIELGDSTTPDGKVITSLILETKRNFVAIPLSHKISEDISVLEDAKVLPKCVFQMRNKKGKDDVEGEYASYTGAPYISFGLPAEITFTKRSLVEPAIDVNAKV